MAKGNMLLGQARGKAGDLVFSRTNGEQVVRARNRHPKNRKTPLQLLQRILLKTSGAAYSAMRGITDHSFQGLITGTPNQSRFVMRNIELFRNQLADVINSGDAELILSSTEANFNSKSVMMPLINPYLISEGTLASIPLTLLALPNALQVYLSAVNLEATEGIPSYQNVIDAYSLQPGDQLTFVAILHDDSNRPSAQPSIITGFEYARVILEPADGDYSKPFLTGSENSPVANANSRNEGSVSFSYAGTALGLAITSINGYPIAKGTANAVAGVAVIVSRYVGGVWMRSTERLQLFTMTNGAAYDFMDQYLGDAIYSYMSGTDSILYLNQAETGRV